MPLTPRENSAATRPADVSPNASTQGYFRDDCATLVTYEWLNEIVADKINALNFLSIPITPNDDNATKKMFEKMLTGGLDYEVNSITVDGRVPFLKGADIPDAADLNSYIEDGYYHQNANVRASNGENYPISEAGMLIVHSHGNMVYQTYYNYRQQGYYIRSKYTDSSNTDTWYPWAEIWTSETDGAGSGLDADLLDGLEGSHYTNADNLNAGKVPVDRLAGQDYIVNSLTASGGKIGLSGDGSQDYLQFTDSDNYLRGYENNNTGAINVQFGTGDYTNLNASSSMTVEGVSVRNAAVLTSGKLNNARLESTITSNTTGNAATATQAENSDTLDGYHGSHYLNASNLSSGEIPSSRMPQKKSWVPTGVTSYTASDCVYVDHGGAVTVSFQIVASNISSFGGLPFSTELPTYFICSNTFGGMAGAISNSKNDSQFMGWVSGSTIFLGHTTALDGDTVYGRVTYIKN